MDAGDSIARSLAGTLAVGAALQPPGRSARPGRTETFWLTGEGARMEPSERNRIEMTGSRVGATSRCSLSSPQNITHSGLSFFIFRSSTLFVRLFLGARVALMAVSPLPFDGARVCKQIKRKGGKKQKKALIINIIWDEPVWLTSGRKWGFFSSLKLRWKHERSPPPPAPPSTKPLFPICVDLFFLGYFKI